jgi:hypothetical protein
MERLTGSALLAHYQDCAKAGTLKGEMVRAAGYTKPLKDGGERVLFGEFSEALLEAKGVTFGSKATAGRPGRELSYETAVLSKGHAVIGQGYLSQIGATPEDRLSIDVQKGKIILRVICPCDATETAAA